MTCIDVAGKTSIVSLDQSYRLTVVNSEYNTSWKGTFEVWHSKERVIPVLTHIPLDKTDAILADDIFKWIFSTENCRIPIQISLKFVARSPVDNNSALAQIIAWHRTGEKSLPEPMMTHLTLENRYGFWPQSGCVTVPGCKAAFLVARQRFPYRSRFNFFGQKHGKEATVQCNLRHNAYRFQ